jgi:hypothetical protein
VPEDIILGKLMAWAEGRSRKHETDIYEIMVFHYLGEDPEQSVAFDEAYIDAQAGTLGAEVADLWESIKGAAGQYESYILRNTQYATRPVDQFKFHAAKGDKLL